MAQLVDAAAALLAHAVNVRGARRCAVALPKRGEVVVRVDGRVAAPRELRALLGNVVSSAKVHVLVALSSGVRIMDDNWVMADAQFASAAATCFEAPGRWHTVEFTITQLEVGLGIQALPALLDLKMSICHVLERAALVCPTVSLTLTQGGGNEVGFEYVPQSTVQEAFHQVYGIALNPVRVDSLDLFVSPLPLPLAQYAKMQICIDADTLLPASSTVVRSIAHRLGRVPPKTCLAFFASLNATQLTRLESTPTPCLEARGEQEPPAKHVSGYRPATLQDLIEVSSFTPRCLSSTPRPGSKLSRNVPEVVSRDDVLHATVIGQFNREFLCVRTSNGKLLCFDQHAAHERVRFERLQREYMQLLEAPGSAGAVTLALKRVDPPVVVFSERALDLVKLRSRGFVATATGARQFAVSQVPIIMGVALTPGHALHSDGRDIPASVLTVLASKACRGAVFFGQVLTSEAMQEIVSGLVECDFPFQCAHGRPCVIPL